jgi:hypothetical protein
MSLRVPSTIRELSVRWYLSPSALVLCGVVVSQATFAQQGSECLQCHTGLPATFSNVIDEDAPVESVVSGACDYSSADLYDGWGWNPILGESCPPLSGSEEVAASTCDYSNADSFAGWGWDPVARESCPPQADSDPHTVFPICSATYFDADGDGFGWEDQASCIITSDSEPAPVFTNRETGNQVALERAIWNGNVDIANRVIQCDLYYFDTRSNQYRLEPVPFRAGANLNNQVFPSYRFRHLSLPLVSPFLGTIASVQYVDGTAITPAAFAGDNYWTTDDSRYIGPTVLQSPYIERITRADGTAAIRTWHESRFDTALDLAASGNRVQRDGYFECRDISGSDFVPTGGSALVTVADECDYSNADSTNGWGWNPVRRESCPPQQVAQSEPVGQAGQSCDYSNADSNGGWGWDAVNQASCAPSTTQQQSATADCDYSNAGINDGWGWNRTTMQSCPPR